MSVDELSWEDLAVLLAGAEHRSLGRAAKALRTSQSTASRRLARIEGRLGARLFDRTPEGLEPTALALDLVPYARLIAGHMFDIRRLASGHEAEPRGRVRVAVIDGLAPFLLLPGIADLRRRYPELQLDLLAGHAVIDLVRGEADVAVRMVAPTTPDLVSRRLMDLPIGVFACPDVAAIAAAAMPWVALYDPELRFQETRWLQDHAQPAHVTHTSTWSDLFTAATLGVGAALLSPLVALPAGLVPVRVETPPPSRSLYLVYHRAMRDVPRIAAVRGWIIEQAEARLAARAAPHSAG